MPWSRPPLATLITRVQSDIKSQLPGTNPLLRRSLLGIMGRAQSGAVHGLYGHQVVLSKQIMPDTAEDDYLRRWAAIWGVPPKAPAVATGPAQATGTEDMVIPAGSLLTGDAGSEFSVVADAVVVAGMAAFTVTGADAGSAGNLPAGSALTFVQPIAGISSGAVVTGAGLGGGTDAETDPELLVRLLQRIQQPPQAGTNDDYVRWASAVAGVTRVWVYPAELAPNGVTVRFAMDDAATGPIPDEATVAAVYAAVKAVCPATVDLTVVAPVETPLNPSIALTPDTQAVRDAVTAELADLLVREASPGGTLLLSHINESIAVAAGETDHVLSVPAADVVYGGGQLAVLGAITWL